MGTFPSAEGFQLLCPNLEADLRQQQEGAVRADGMHEKTGRDGGDTCEAWTPNLDWGRQGSLFLQTLLGDSPAYTLIQASGLQKCERMSAFCCCESPCMVTCDSPGDKHEGPVTPALTFTFFRPGRQPEVVTIFWVCEGSGSKPW